MRRLLAIVDVKSNKTVWADASSFAGVETKAKPADPDVPRVLDWSVPDVSDDGAHMVAAVRSQDNKDRWFVSIDPATGKATRHRPLHDDAWIREQAIGGGAGLGGGAGIAWLPDNKRFLFLSEKDGYMHLYSLDMSASAPAAKQLTSGKWEVDRRAALVTIAGRCSSRRTKCIPASGTSTRCRSTAARATKITTMTGSNDATVSPDEKSLGADLLVQQPSRRSCT